MHPCLLASERSLFFGTSRGSGLIFIHVRGMRQHHYFWHHASKKSHKITPPSVSKRFICSLLPTFLPWFSPSFLFPYFLFFSWFNFSISYFYLSLVHVDYVNYHVVIFMAHLHLNELLLICDMWLNKITYLLTYLLHQWNAFRCHALILA